ncbi:MAG: ABC transporter permease [Chloroflexales bacterium]|nr:ABC transporter permease [Chloroflexales bacterium]
MQHPDVAPAPRKLTAARGRSSRLNISRLLLRTTAVLVFGFILIPVVFVVWISFFSNQIISFPAQGYTLRWYANIWLQRAFADGFRLSLQVAVLSMFGGLLVGVPAALGLVRYRFPGREALNTLLLSPLVVPGIVAGIALFVFLVRIGELLGVRLTATIPGLALAHILLTIPWTVRLIAASLIGMDRSVEEAAMNLGANPWVTFYRVTLPMIRAGIVAAAIFSFITSFTNLEFSLLLVGPGRTTLPIAVLQYLEFNLDPTIAAVATVQITITAVAMLITDRLVGLGQVVRR